MTALGIDRRQAFASAAPTYAKQARLQQAAAWRLAKLCRALPLPPGPVLDLGAGPGNLAEALRQQRPELQPLLVDDCAELLAEAPAPRGQRLLWDLNQGLPDGAQGAALLMSSFALHWLDAPLTQLVLWGRALAPTGWLALLVPVAGSFTGWRQAAKRAGVACTALGLPQADELTKTISGHLQLQSCKLLRFTRPYDSPLQFLRELKQLGVHGGGGKPLGVAECRQLLKHWPQQTSGGIRVNWDLQIILAQKRNENR
ncbi:MAG: hypothetical protein RLZZ158_862 [Cyanobacteriota bacterium]